MFWFLKSVTEKEFFLRVIVIEDECIEKNPPVPRAEGNLYRVLERRLSFFLQNVREQNSQAVG